MSSQQNPSASRRFVPPSPPHPPSASLPPFRPPPRTPVTLGIGIRSASAGAANAKPVAPLRAGSKGLPAGYKVAERRVRTVIVGLPIAIVTSLLLYKRLFKGEERKSIIKNPPGIP